MAAGQDIEGPAPTLEDALQVLEQFLAGQVHQDLMLATLLRVVAEDGSAAHPLQEKIDSALRASELAEPVWERITAELDHALSEDAPTEWPADDATAPQPGDPFAETGASAPLAEPESGPPVLDDPVTPAAPPIDKTAATHLPPGTLLGDRYVIVSRAHAGGMGDVYKALDRAKKESGDPAPWVAIKIPSREFASHPQALNTLEREAEICRSMSHENVVRVFSFERDGNTCFLTMEWLEGESLVQLLERTRHKAPNPTQLRRIILGLGAALAHAHARGITHADVKPGNVFVTHGGEIKLLDFGAARSAASDYEANVAAKTPAYASCEVLEGQDPEPGDDVFSYALLIYRLLAGRRAFGQSNALEAEAGNLKPERIASLADQAWTALAQALAFRRTRRPADVASFLEAFTAPPKSESEPASTAVEDEEDQASPVASTPVSATEPIPMQTATMIGVSDHGSESEHVDPDAETGIAAAHVPETETAGSGWTRPALAAAAVLACSGVAWWLWPAEPLPAPMAKPPRTPPMASLPPPGPVGRAADALAPVTVEARRLDAPLRIDINDAEADGPIAGSAAAVGAESMVPATAVSELEGAPEPDAQLASVVAAAAVSRAARDAGETAQLPAEAAEPAPRARPQPEPQSESEPAPQAEPETRPAAAGAMADTAAGNAPAAAPVLARQAPPQETAKPALPVTPGSVASVGPPIPVRSTVTPDDYGPAPAPAPAGPRDVAMSELEFSRFVEPRYPRARSARKTRGWAQVEFHVDPEGKTRNVRVTASSPPKLFDEPAITAVEKWRFKPFVVDGEAIIVSSAVRLRFEPQR